MKTFLSLRKETKRLRALTLSKNSLFRKEQKCIDALFKSEQFRLKILFCNEKKNTAFILSAILWQMKNDFLYWKNVRFIKMLLLDREDFSENTTLTKH